MNQAPIEISAYDPGWPLMFEKEKEHLEKVAGD
jgi:GrpB-like predicted nucleotidyltransferase (UPF0157 family)